MSKITEDEVEQLALAWFKELGYAYRPGPSLLADSTRANTSQVVLAPLLEASLSKINPKAPPAAIQAAVEKLCNFDTPDLVLGNKAFYRMLVEGVTVRYSANGEQHSALVTVVDYAAPDNNDWLVVNQFEVAGPTQTRRPDVVMFLNGLPLVVFELKNPVDERATAKRALTQLENYKTDIKSLFYHNAFCVISDYLNAKFGSLTSDAARYSSWKSIAGVANPLGLHRELETLIRGLFDKQTFLAYVRSFILFEDDTPLVKKVAGYHQFDAVQAVVARVIQAAAPEGDRKGGVVWHTQGSGKSLEMVCAAGLLMTSPELCSPTIVMVTDRIDLDNQLLGTFLKNQSTLRDAPVQADSRMELRRILESQPSGGIIFTTIQKFGVDDTEVEFPALTLRSNVVVICDEAHRTQYGFDVKYRDGAVKPGYAQNMRDALPNATFVGYTGTPITASDRDTRGVFGEYVHVYDIKQAVEDGATVPMYYDLRFIPMDLNPDQLGELDRMAERLSETGDVTEEAAQKQKWASIEKIVTARPRMAKMALDIVSHFEERQKVLGGKAIVVAMSRSACVTLYEEIVKLRPAWHADGLLDGQIKVVITGNATDERRLIDHQRSKDDNQKLAARLKDPLDALKIVIVRDMWLTGFDAPVVNTMYLDKPMKGANLMQAITRANRVFKGKPAGLVVDYFNLAGALAAAADEYTNSKGKGTPVNDILKAVDILAQAMEAIRELLKGCQYADYSTKSLELLPILMDFILGLPGATPTDGKKAFNDKVRLAQQALKICGTHEKARQYRAEFGFYEMVKAGLVKAEPGNSLTSSQNGEAMTQLLSESVLAVAAQDIFGLAGLARPNTDILSSEFLASFQTAPKKNLAMALLEKLLKEGVAKRFNANIVQHKKFSSMVEDVLCRYRAQAIETAHAMAELIEVGQALESERSESLINGVSPAERAFADVLLEVAGPQAPAPEVLAEIAAELSLRLKEKASQDWRDWPHRPPIRAQMESKAKQILQNSDFPEGCIASAVARGMQQAEALGLEWV